MPIGRIADLAYPLTLQQFMDAVGISMKGQPSDEMLAAHGFFWADTVAPPAPSAPYKAVTGPVVALVSGKYVEQYAERDMANGEMVVAVDTEKSRRLGGGAPISGKTYQVDALSLATINGMLHAASLSLGGLIPWGAPYDRRIADDNTVTTFTTAIDAITFAAAIGAWFGNTTLYARTLKDRALTGEKFDYTTGWP